MLRALITIGLFSSVFSNCIAVELPTGGAPLVDKGTVIDQLNVRLQNDTFGSHKFEEVEHPEFDRVLKINLNKQPKNTWDTAFGLPVAGPVAQGDLLLVGFWLRGKSASGVGGAIAEFVFEKSSEPYTKSTQFLAESPSDGSWEHYWVRFRSLEDYPKGGAVLNFQIGYQPESMEFAGLEAWNFGQSTHEESLPVTELTYAGRSSDAAWRKAAADRIEKQRKANFTMTIRDANGRTKPGARVSVKLDRHAFDFGTAVSVEMLTGSGEDNDRYRETFERYFNSATIENGLKWKSWDDQSTHDATIEALKRLQAKRIPTRGHVMVWPGFGNSPDWISSIVDRPVALGKVIDMHIREMGYATQGLVRDWDVLNEAFDNVDLTAALGDEAMINWFKVADKVAPGVDLYYNDYASLVRGGFPTAHKEHFTKTVRYLKENGAPIDGIGVQGHFGTLLTSPERMLAELDRLQELGLKILITEFDVEVAGKSLQSDFTRDFLTVCFSHPAVVGVLTWGFWEGAHWKPDAALFTKDWTPTAVGEQWIRMTQQEWTTELDLVADDNGEVSFRGFLGEYIVRTDGNEIRFKADASNRLQAITK